MEIKSGNSTSEFNLSVVAMVLMAVICAIGMYMKYTPEQIAFLLGGFGIPAGGTAASYSLSRAKVKAAELIADAEAALIREGDPK